jgi:hypothetical protein
MGQTEIKRAKQFQKRTEINRARRALFSPFSGRMLYPYFLPSGRGILQPGRRLASTSERLFVRKKLTLRTTVKGLGESVTSTWHEAMPVRSEAGPVCAVPPPAERETRSVVATATKH